MPWIYVPNCGIILPLQTDLLISQFEVTWAWKRSIRLSKKITLKKLDVIPLTIVIASESNIEHHRPTRFRMTGCGMIDRNIHHMIYTYHQPLF